MSADLVVYNANTSGIAAAIDAGRRGIKTTLIEPTNKIGGVWAGGLGQTDREITPVAGGAMRWGIMSEMETRFGSLFPTMEKVTSVLSEMLSEVSNNVTLVMDKSMTSVNKSGDTGIINSITCGGIVYPGKNFIDAGDEGDLPWMAGCLMRVGRESKAVTGEPTAGVRPPLTVLTPSYDPATGDRYPTVGPRPAQAYGYADRRNMAYCMRLIVTQDPARINWADLAVNPDPKMYKADLEIAVKSGYKTIPMSIGRELVPIVGIQQQDGNNGGLIRIGTNWIGQFLDWPSMNWDQRKVRRDEYIIRTAGLFKVMCTDPEWANRLPEMVADAKTWGLVPGLFTDSVIPGFSPYMYVRNARRIVGQEDRVFKSVMAPETNIGVKEPMTLYGYAHVDAHWYQRYADATGNIAFEGGSGLDNGEDVVASLMPWGALKTRYTDARNLTVARCFSGTMLGWINGRIEISYVKLGQVCGIAAGVACQKDMFTGDLQYKRDILPALITAGAMIKIPGVPDNV